MRRVARMFFRVNPSRSAWCIRENVRVNQPQEEGG